jgi:hypothetical protein
MTRCVVENITRRVMSVKSDNLVIEVSVWVSHAHSDTSYQAQRHNFHYDKVIMFLYERYIQKDENPVYF